MSHGTIIDEKNIEETAVSELNVCATDKHEIGAELYAQADDIEWTDADEKRVRIKIDWRILPCMMMTQGLSYLDKTALNYGKLFGMQAALGATSAQFAWYASGFYIGYLFASYPVGLLLQKFNTGRVMGIVCFFWGITVMSTAGCTNFAGGLVNRIILGALEAGVTPGLGLMTPFWWTIDEIPRRHLAWYAMNSFSGVPGGIMAYGLGHLTNIAVPSWAMIFLILGAVTTIWSFVLFFFLPDSPASATFLSPREKIIAIKRVARNRTGTKNTKFKWAQVWECVRDPKTYLLFAAAAGGQLPNGIIANFSTTIISGFGFDQLQTTLLDIPSSLCATGPLILAAYIAGKYKNTRALLMFVGNLICIAMACILTYAPRSLTWGRLVAFWLTGFGSIGFAMSLIMVSSNVGGYTKRQTMTAITFVGYCIGNIAGPQSLIGSEVLEGYPTATKCMLAGYVIKTVTMGTLGVYMWNDNRRRDAKAREAGDTTTEEERALLAEQVAMGDVTEWNNPHFRYVY